MSEVVTVTVLSAQHKIVADIRIRTSVSERILILVISPLTHMTFFKKQTFVKIIIFSLGYVSSSVQLKSDRAVLENDGFETSHVHFPPSSAAGRAGGARARGSVWRL